MMIAFLLLQSCWTLLLPACHSKARAKQAVFELWLQSLQRNPEVWGNCGYYRARRKVAYEKEGLESQNVW